MKSQHLKYAAVATALISFVTAAQAQSPGNEDTSFAAGPNANSTVLALALQPNGQVLAGGIFTTFRGAARNLVARLNPNGSLDSFNPGLVLSGYNGGAPAVNALGVQSDGRIIVAGIFNVLNQQPGGGVARLNADASLDSTFDAGTGVVDDGDQVGQADAVAVLPNGQILVGGAFSSFSGASVAGLVRLNTDGSVDASFNAGGAGISPNAYGGDVRSIVVESTGKILIGGHFSAYDGVTANCVARLNTDGTPDLTFNAGSGADVAVFVLAVQADGKVLAGGGFNNFDNLSIASHLVRLNTDGSLDTGYNPTLDLFIEEVDAILVQPDGEAIIGGTFLAEGGLVNSPANGVARLYEDGTQDTRFDAGTSTDTDQALALALQPNGELLAAIDFGAGYTYPSDVFRLYDITVAPTATITPEVAQTLENSGMPAILAVHLSSAQANDVTVSYTVKGSAKAGIDYRKLTGTVTIKAGKTSKQINVFARNRGIKGGKVSVKLTLEPGTGYEVGKPATATISIRDNK